MQLNKNDSEPEWSEDESDESVSRRENKWAWEWKQATLIIFHEFSLVGRTKELHLKKTMLWTETQFNVVS